MDVNLIISSADLNNNQLQDLTMSLANDMNKLNNLKAKLSYRQPQESIKGEPITFGVILLSILKGGSLVALITLLQHYFLREPTLKISIQKKDGTKLTFEQKNMNQEKIADILKLIEDFSGN
jgi:hypothetical protein